MKLLTFKAHACPQCGEKSLPRELIKKPFVGTRRWFEFTPAPTLHCPHCRISLIVAGWHKGWLGLTFINLMVMIGLLFVQEKAFFLAKALPLFCFILAYIGLVSAQRHTFYQSNKND